MITLLLTFFVLLVSLGRIRDETLFDEGQGLGTSSFLLGVKAGFGFKTAPDFGNISIKYFTGNPDDEFGGRLIDAKEEEIRRVFKNISQSMKAMPSQIVGQKSNFSPTDIHFSPGIAALNTEAAQFLKEFRLHLQQDLGGRTTSLCVLGLATDAATEKEQWLLSAQRAQAVAQFLQGLCTRDEGAGTKEDFWQIYWWGAGPGGDWVARDSPISQNCQILIAVLKAGN